MNAEVKENIVASIVFAYNVGVDHVNLWTGLGQVAGDQPEGREPVATPDAGQ